MTHAQNFTFHICAVSLHSYRFHGVVKSSSAAEITCLRFDSRGDSAACRLESSCLPMRGARRHYGALNMMLETVVKSSGHLEHTIGSSYHR